MWILYTIIFIVLISAAHAGVSAAPWVPTKKPDLERIQKLLALQSDDRFIELGAGNGRVSRHLARTSAADIDGVELSVLPWFWANVHNKISRSSAKTRMKSLYSTNLQDKTAVYMFLMPEVYKKIKGKLTSELPKGARVVSYVWPIPDWEPVKVDTLENGNDLYLYNM